MENIVVPDIYCPFPSLISPHLEEVRAYQLVWLKSLHLVQEEATLNYYRATDLALCTCRCHPRAGLAELCLANIWTTWAVICDDHMDNTFDLQFHQELCEHVLLLLQDSPLVAPQGHLARALLDFWQKACLITTPTWRRRFASQHQDWFKASAWQTENTLHQIIPTLESYVAHRPASVAAQACYSMIDLTGYLHIPDEIYESSPFQEILLAIGNATGWTNDVISVRRDLASGQFNNLVVIIQRERGCSLQEAVNQVCALIETETRRFQALVQKFLDENSEIGRDAHTFLSDLGIWLRGALDWQRSCEWQRYAPDVMRAASGHLVTVPLEAAILPH